MTAIKRIVQTAFIVCTALIAAGLAYVFAIVSSPSTIGGVAIGVVVGSVVGAGGFVLWRRIVKDWH